MKNSKSKYFFSGKTKHTKLKQLPKETYAEALEKFKAEKVQKDRLINGEYVLVSKEFEVNDEVSFLIDGEKVLLPAGVFDLQSGITIVVDNFGVIEEASKTVKEQSALSKIFRKLRN